MFVFWTTVDPDDEEDDDADDDGHDDYGDDDDDDEVAATVDLNCSPNYWVPKTGQQKQQYIV